jgi:geranylgeranyl diphosphate synthase type II
MTRASAAALLVKHALEEYRHLLQKRLQQGWREQAWPAALLALATDYPQRGGRALRASLCIATAQAFGAAIEQSLDSAVSIELMHNAFLVHDDIEDDSEQRRGQPTLHRIHGIAAALNAGDALALMGLGPLLANCATLGPRLGLRILEEAHAMACETVAGQALELAWRNRDIATLTAADYLCMSLKKTSWYTIIYPCRVGALIGTRDTVDLDQFVKYGFFVGAAFQIQDDVLNLVGDAASYGKELNGDLSEGKRTLLLIHTLEHADARVRKRLSQLLALPRAQRTARAVAWIRRAIEDHGSIEYARGLAHALAGAAEHEYERAFGASARGPGAAFLKALPRWVLERA